MNQHISIEDLNPLDYILVKGARVHNLKNIDVAIPRDKLVVVTGLSGSGKSSLAFETLYAEGQRRYVESLSSYARQFLGRLDKPDVDYIHGISPAVAIEQRVNSRNPRSTVGTTTEIYDYLKLLFARIGQTISPVSGKLVTRHTPGAVADYVTSQPLNSRVYLSCPLNLHDKSLEERIRVLLQQGFSRFFHDGRLQRIDSFLEEKPDSIILPALLVGRLMIQEPLDQSLWSQVADFAHTAFLEGQGTCHVHVEDTSGKIETHAFSSQFEADGISFEEPSVHLFSFNNPFGACKTCEGFGKILGIDEDLVIPDQSLSVYAGAVACWKGEKMSEWQEDFILKAEDYGFPIHTPYFELSPIHKKLLWDGARELPGIRPFFQMVEANLYKIQYRVLLSRFRGRTDCPDCQGTRLRKDAGYVKVGGKSIIELVLFTVEDLRQFFTQLHLPDHQQHIANRLLTEINNRLLYLCDVGLGYLQLNRLSSTLSGGESQRINLATSLGSSLVGSMYILDEPSIGLHPRDTKRLVKVVERLRDEGNTVIVVEHDDAFMHAADHLLDLGPEAGALGGHVVFSGTLDQLPKASQSYTAQYLTGERKIPVPISRRAWKKQLVVEGALENNLKDLKVVFPLGVLTAVTGVSGSGKTSLIKDILYPALKKRLGMHADRTGKYGRLTGDVFELTDVEMVDQNPIGKSSRSNPTTYLKIYDEIRALYAGLPAAKAQGFKPATFSFNVPGGRCEVCEGDGTVTIEMQFMADLTLPCENCKGKRFKEEVLEVKYHGKSIADVLDMTVDEAIEFFQHSSIDKRIAEKFKPLQEVGLGYIGLGQSASTLSGGEAQRVKLAWFLSRGAGEGKRLFIFDEPTTGLHVHDVNKLLAAFHALLEKGHSVLVIEHHMDVVKCADWVIDLGPEGGPDGGQLVAAGTPEDLLKVKESYTAKALAETMKK